jgi:hypothetical protein
VSLPLLGAGPAVDVPPAPPASIGAPVLLGTEVTLTNASADITMATEATAPAGSRVFVYADTHSAVLPVGITNSGTVLSWVAGDAINQGGQKRMYWADITSDLPSGTTITVTGGAPGRMNLVACYATGFTPGTPADTRATPGASGSFVAPSTSPPTIDSGALASGVEKLVFGMVELAGGAADSEITEATGFTKIGAEGGTLWLLHLAYKIVAAGDTSAQTYAPTLSTTRNWVVDIISFRAA